MLFFDCPKLITAINKNAIVINFFTIIFKFNFCYSNFFPVSVVDSYLSRRFVFHLKPTVAIANKSFLHEPVSYEWKPNSGLIYSRNRGCPTSKQMPTEAKIGVLVVSVLFSSAASLYLHLPTSKEPSFAPAVKLIGLRLNSVHSYVRYTLLRFEFDSPNVPITVPRLRKFNIKVLSPPIPMRWCLN